MSTESVSQCQVVGAPRVRSWADYRHGCLSTYGGGHHDDGHLDAYQHGMETIFNLLEAEFPPAEVCKAGTALLEACKCANKMLANLAATGGEWTTEDWCRTQQTLAKAIQLSGEKLPSQKAEMLSEDGE